jgi:hypothetical protein
MAPKKHRKLPATKPEGRKRRLLALQGTANKDSDNKGALQKLDGCKRRSLASQAKPTQDLDNDTPSQIPSSQTIRIPLCKPKAAKHVDDFSSDEEMEQVTFIKLPTSR